MNFEHWLTTTIIIFSFAAVASEIVHALSPDFEWNERLRKNTEALLNDLLGGLFLICILVAVGLALLIFSPVILLSYLILTLVDFIKSKRQKSHQ